MGEWRMDREMGWAAGRASGHRRGMSSLWRAGWTSAKARCNIKVVDGDWVAGDLTV